MQLQEPAKKDHPFVRVMKQHLARGIIATSGLATSLTSLAQAQQTQSVQDTVVRQANDTLTSTSLPPGKNQDADIGKLRWSPNANITLKGEYDARFGRGGSMTILDGNSNYAR